MPNYDTIEEWRNGQLQSSRQVEVPQREWTRRERFQRIKALLQQGNLTAAELKELLVKFVRHQLDEDEP